MESSSYDEVQQSMYTGDKKIQKNRHEVSISFVCFQGELGLQNLRTYGSYGVLTPIENPRSKYFFISVKYSTKIEGINPTPNRPQSRTRRPTQSKIKCFFKIMTLLCPMIPLVLIRELAVVVEWFPDTLKCV